MGARERLNVGEIKFKGISTRVGANTYRVLARDGSGRIVLAVTTLADPTGETGAGFSKGALIIKSDAADGTKAIYENQGTVSTASMNLMGVVSGADIATSAVVTAKLADTAVTAAKLGGNAVTSAKIITSAVLTTRIGDLAVTTGKINTSAVTSAKIASSAVTASKVADASIAEGKLGAAAVAKAKVKYIQATMAVASAAASLSVSSASFTSGEIVGVTPALTNFVGNIVLQKVSLTASTAKVSLSGATTHTGGATYILTILRA